MSTSNITKTAISKSQANDRLGQIQGHMGSTEKSEATAFSADVVPQAPEDALFGLMAAYRKDEDSKKVDLGIGAYRDDNAKPWVLPVVKEVRITTGRASEVSMKPFLTTTNRQRNSCERTQI